MILECMMQSLTTGYYEGLLCECNRMWELMIILIGILNHPKPWSSPYTRVASLNSPLLMLMCRLVYSPSARVTSRKYIPPDWPNGPKDRPNPLGPRSHPVTHIVSLTYPAWKSNYLNKLLRQWKCRSFLYECSNCTIDYFAARWDCWLFWSEMALLVFFSVRWRCR